MRLVLDGKSLAVGAFAGAALVAALGAAQQQDQPQPGRFRITAAGTSGATYAYVLDTATGRVWRDSERNFSGPKLDAE